MPTLNTTQEAVERSLFEALRLVLVEYGYLPDVTSFPYNATGQADYDAAKKAISEDSNYGFCIELFGVGSQESKFLKRVPRIVIVKRRLAPSVEIGANSSPYYVLNDEGKYDKLKGPNTVVDAYYDLIFSNESAKQDRVMNAIMFQALPGLGYIEKWDDSNTHFFIDWQGQYEQHDHEEGVHNYHVTLRIPDLCLANPVVLGEVAKIQEITLDTLTVNNLPPSSTMVIGEIPDFDGGDFDGGDFDTP